MAALRRVWAAIGSITTIRGIPRDVLEKLQELQNIYRNNDAEAENDEAGQERPHSQDSDRQRSEFSLAQSGDNAGGNNEQETQSSHEGQASAGQAGNTTSQPNEASIQDDAIPSVKATMDNLPGLIPCNSLINHSVASVNTATDITTNFVPTTSALENTAPSVTAGINSAPSTEPSHSALSNSVPSVKAAMNLAPSSVPSLWAGSSAGDCSPSHATTGCDTKARHSGKQEANSRQWRWGPEATCDDMVQFYTKIYSIGAPPVLPFQTNQDFCETQTTEHTANSTAQSSMALLRYLDSDMKNPVTREELPQLK